MGKKYVKCDTCGKKIYLGNEILGFGGRCGVYCSAECFADAHAATKVLNEAEAENCRCEIFDEETDKLNALADLYIKDTECDGQLFCGCRREECDDWKTESCRKCVMNMLEERENEGED